MHKLTQIKGTHANNHIVKCKCGWAYSSTHLDCVAVGHGHLLENNEFAWHDERRRAQKESPFSRHRRI